jgi:hypothetical protein
VLAAARRTSGKSEEVASFGSCSGDYDCSIAETTVRHSISLLDPYLSAEEKQRVRLTSRGGGCAMEERAFAIIRLSGTQYKVTIDDVIVCDILGGHEVGDTIEVSEVLLFGTQNEVSSSRPWGG